jgi:DTW domain-containing protein
VSTSLAPRDVCWRCRRPERVCYCEHIPNLPTRTRLVFLQHVRERRMPIGTARMAHLALPNSEFHVGIGFEDNPRVASLAHSPGTFLLFPSPGARELGELLPGELKTLVVVDGTWPLAKKLIRINPVLQAIPKLAFSPSRPGNYRIRMEPAEHCLSTIEAVAEVLGQLEGEPERFCRMLRAFDAMVDWQIEAARTRTGPRRKLLRGPRPSNAQRVAQELGSPPLPLVLAYAESNGAWVEGRRRHEIIHLVAFKPSTGERFEALVRPDRPLEPAAAEHSELDPEEIRAGEPRPSACARFEAFVEGCALASWGPFTLGLLRQAAPDLRQLDLRERVIRVLEAKPGGLEEAAVALGGPAPCGGHGRANRRLQALQTVVDRLCSHP